MTSNISAAFSAPGKVLLAGGYLVLDRAYTGLVFGLDARIHVLVEPLEGAVGVVDEIIVRSPQFKDTEWRYGYRVMEESAGVEVVQLKGASRNKFVEAALGHALTYVSCHASTRMTPASITILADSDYYSQSQTSTRCMQNPASQFMNFNVALSDAHKTGLGSSAALVTAFVAAVLAHYSPAGGDVLCLEPWRTRVHNLAQAAHCTAQGKVGSGFDVAAAVFGSCVYKRFSPTILESLGSIGSTEFSIRLKTIVDDSSPQRIWDTQVNESMVTMPKGLRLIMCDVDSGSETPGMVKQVLRWRKENPDMALRLWDALQSGNDELAVELKRLSHGLDESFENLGNILLKIRSLIRHMTGESGVPIEPDVQKDLLDNCTLVQGVIGGVVPGAGGYDAITLIIEDREEVIKELVTTLESYRPSDADNLEQTIGKVRLLGVRQEMGGLRKEVAATHEGW